MANVSFLLIQEIIRRVLHELEMRIVSRARQRQHKNFMPSICRNLIILLGAMTTTAAQPEATIKIHADQVRCRLSDEVRGANMEDLHYQMVGGFDSQLIHGESFFEPSPTELAHKSGRVEGFTSVAGRWQVQSDGILRVNVRDGQSEIPGGVPVEANVDANDKEIGARLLSKAPAPANTVETACDFWFPSRSQGSAALIFHVHPNQADNGWMWYSGYTLSLEPKQKKVVLSRANRANKHVEIAQSTAEITEGTWNAVAVRVGDGKISVTLNEKLVLACEEPQPLAIGHFGLVARENVLFRNLTLQDATGLLQPVPFQTGKLIENPGDAISLRWAKVQTGDARGSFELLKPGEGTWFPNCPSQKIEFSSGQGEIGIDNAGLTRWGLSLQSGKDYEGFLRVKTSQPTDFQVSLRSADGKTIHATQKLKTTGNGIFEKIAFTLTPAASDANGRFAVTLSTPGGITLGYAFLQPGEWGRFRGLPIRKDLAEALVAQGISLLRLNGGMIEVPGYRWKTLQGPRDTRPPFDGFYDRYSSSGYGPIEHLRFCEAAGFTPVIGLNFDETPESVADFVAYATAPADTPAGARRAADGHPAPFHMPYYQVANETRFNEAYVEKFKQVAEAVWKVAPDITLITTSAGGYSGDDEAAAKEKLALHLDLVRFCEDRGKKLFIDCHAFNGPPDIPKFIQFAKWVKKFARNPDSVSVGVLELNAGAFDFGRGLSHALELNAAHRRGDLIIATGMPNLSQPWNVYQTDWKAVLWTQGNIYYTQDKVWFQPAYYVDQIIAQSWASDIVRTDVSDPLQKLDALAAKSADGTALVLRVVNPSDRSIQTHLDIAGFEPRDREAVVQTLASEDLRTFNSLEQPDKIRPARTLWRHNGELKTYSFPPRSFTIIYLR